MIDKSDIAGFYPDVEVMAESQQLGSPIVRSNSAVDVSMSLRLYSNSSRSKFQLLTHALRNQRLEIRLKTLPMIKNLDHLKQQSEVAASPGISPSAMDTNAEQRAEALLHIRIANLAAHSEQMCAASTVLVLRSKDAMRKATIAMRTFERLNSKLSSQSSTYRQSANCEESSQ